MKTKVTVIIPFYNNFMLLKKAIDSVKNQSFRNYLKRDLVVLLCLPYGRILTFYEL